MSMIINPYAFGSGGVSPATAWRVRAGSTHSGDDVFAPIDLMLLATPTSTSMISTGTASFSGSGNNPASYAWDGLNVEPNVAWVTSPSSGLAFTFGSAQAPTAIKLVARYSASFYNQMPVELFVEEFVGGSWVAALHLTSIPAWLPGEQRIYAFTAASGSDFTWPWAQQTHARVRSSDTYISGDYLGIAELELRATSGGADMTTGLTATANSNIGSPYTPSAAIDDNNSTFWTSGALSPPTSGYTGHWVAVNVTSPPAEVALRVRPDGFREDPTNLFVDLSFDNAATFVQYWSAGAIGTWTAGQQKVFTKP